MSSETKQTTIIKLVDKGLSVIIGLVSNFVFDAIDIKSNRLELSLVVIIVFLLFNSADGFIRKWLKKLNVLETNKVWQEVLLGILDFILLLGIFLVIQLILEFLESGISNSDPNLFEIFVGIFTLMLIGFSIVQTIKRYTLSKERSTIVRLFNRGISVIIGLVSNFVFDIIDIKSNRLELFLVVIIVFLLWVSADGFIRKWLKKLNVLETNKVWQKVLLGILDFILLLGIFLVIQLILEFLESGISNSDPNLFEIFVGIFALMLIGFSIVQTIKRYTLSKERSTIVRLFDKGLSVIIGLVSNFVFDIIDIKSNRLELFLVVIIVFLLWVSADRFIRKWVKKLNVLETNKVWQSVLLGILDFVILLGTFLVIQLILEFLKNGISNINPNLFEIFVGIFALMLIGFSIVQTIKRYTLKKRISN